MATCLRIELVESNTTVGEVLIDCEEDRTLRAVLVGMLRELPLVGEVALEAGLTGARNLRD